MADEPITPQSRFIEAAPNTPVEGGPDSQSLDGISSNSNNPGVSLAKALKGNKGRGRGHGPERSGNNPQSNNEGARSEPAPSPAQTPNNNPFRQSDNILQTIADHFVEARKLQKAEAWRQLQVDLMHASPFICPAVIPYKDLISIVSEIEKEIKGGTSQAGKSNEEIIAGFLSGQGSLVVVEMDIGPDLSRDKSLDSHAIIKEGEGEDGPVLDIPLSSGPSNTPSSPSPDNISDR